MIIGGKKYPRIQFHTPDRFTATGIPYLLIPIFLNFQIKISNSTAVIQQNHWRIKIRLSSITYPAGFYGLLCRKPLATRSLALILGFHRSFPLKYLCSSMSLFFFIHKETRFIDCNRRGILSAVKHNSTNICI